MEGEPSRSVSPDSKNGSSKSFGGSFGEANSSFLDDFILISEFSELEGPVPLFSVPEGSQGSFNVNSFVLRVMAVDYQNRATDITALAEDTQVYLTQPLDNAVAYAHHFTLLDICARGYVRPICMSYITHDSKKVMNHFNEFLIQFAEVASILKSGNREIFKRDLDARIADLKLTQEAVLHRRNSEEGNQKDDSMVLPTPNTVSEYIKDLKALHKRLHSANRTKSSQTKEEGESRSIDDSPNKEMEVSVSPIPSPREDSQEDTANSFNSTLEGDLGKLDDYQPKLVFALERSAYFHEKTSLRTLAELCGNSYDKGLEKLRNIQAHFSRHTILLQLLKDDEPLLVPSSSLLSIGRAIMLNFNLNSASLEKWGIEKEDSLTPYMSPPSSSDSSYQSPHSTLSDSPANLLPEGFIEAGNNLNGAPQVILHSASFSSADVSKDIQSENSNELYGFASLLWGNTVSRGNDISLTDLKSKYSFTKHLLFSLLKGRTVVIYAHHSSQSQVVKLIGACSMFVPGYGENRVIPWLNRNLKMSDIATTKLLGFSKSKSIPKPLEKYVSVLDFEAESFRGPPYSSGCLIEEILTVKKQWPNEETYVAYVQAILFEMSLKACMYYHLCCVGVSAQSIDEESEDQESPRENKRNSAIGDNTSVQIKKAQDRITRTKRSLSDSQLTAKTLPSLSPAEYTKEIFFKKTNFETTDIEIIEYLAEVVKDQQLSQIHGEKLVPIIRLDHTPCVVFKNPKRT